METMYSCVSTPKCSRRWRKANGAWSLNRKCSAEWPGVSGEPSGGNSCLKAVLKSFLVSSRLRSDAIRPTLYETPSLMFSIMFHEGWPL